MKSKDTHKNINKNTNSSSPVVFLLLASTLLIVLVNGYGLFTSVLASNDANFYAIIAKNIYLSHDWLNLTFNCTDWLDKPHLPFWLVATSYQLFGVSATSYILPGFLFNLIGAFYTYQLAAKLYGNRVIALLSVVMYLSSLHLLLSSIDVRAEAFLLGTITPANYYLLCFALKYKNNFVCKHVSSLKHRSYWPFMCAAFFAALALMTKGIFVLLPITSGIIGLYLYHLIQLKRIDKKDAFRLRNGYCNTYINNIPIEFSKQFWLYLLVWMVMVLVFTIPELYALYEQFDLHPEKIIFGHNHVSGLKFFFFDSQFGRFFNTGPIAIGLHKNVWHYFFFVHTFFWAFLPWSIAYIAALIVLLRRVVFAFKGNINRMYLWQDVYLIASFFPIFILFSLTKFQLDHYTNIIVPYAAIITATYLHRIFQTKKCLSKAKLLLNLQCSILILLLLLIIALMLLMLPFFASKIPAILFILLIVGSVFLLIMAIILLYKTNVRTSTANNTCNKTYNNTYINVRLACYYLALSIGIIAIVFICVTTVNAFIYSRYDAGLNVAKITNQYESAPLLDYGVNVLSAEFQVKNHYVRLDDLLRANDIIENMKISPAGNSILPTTMIVNSQSRKALYNNHSGGHSSFYLLIKSNNLKQVANFYQHQCLLVKGGDFAFHQTVKQSYILQNRVYRCYNIAQIWDFPFIKSENLVPFLLTQGCYWYKIKNIYYTLAGKSALMTKTDKDKQESWLKTSCFHVAPPSERVMLLLLKDY